MLSSQLRNIPCGAKQRASANIHRCCFTAATCLAFSVASALQHFRLLEAIATSNLHGCHVLLQLTWQLQVKYSHGMPFPLNYILPRIHQFHVWQMLKLTTAEQVIKCMSWLLAQDSLHNALNPMCMLAMCCSAMSLEQGYGYYAGVVLQVTSLAAAAVESNPNEDGIHLMSLHVDEYLAGL